MAQGQSTTVLPTAQAQKPRFTAEWRLRLTGEDESDLQSQSKMVNFAVDLKSEYRLSSSLLMDIQPSFRLQSGQTQSMDGADKAENKIILKQVAAHYTPFRFLRFSAGALSQQYTHTSLLIDDLAFPAARINTLLKGDQWGTQFVVETAIPTSTSMSTNTNQIEATPSINTAALKLNWMASRRLNWKNSVGYFAYANLPSAVAKDSLFLGNDVNQITSADYKFVYEFQGIEASSTFSFPVLTALDMYVGGEYLRNDKAPSDTNSASKYLVGGELTMNKDFALSLETSYFSVAPNAAVAYFNARGYETNRVGYAVESYLSFKQQGFRVGLKYTDADLMYVEKDQSRRKSLMIKLETFYASI